MKGKRAALRCLIFLKSTILKNALNISYLALTIWKRKLGTSGSKNYLHFSNLIITLEKIEFVRV
jgi:hypothetical protein